MRRNCNLELRLLPSAAADAEFGNHHHHRQHMMMGESSDQSPQNQRHQQQLTIFYNGRVCVCDVTEFQARAILLLASREMEGRMKTPSGSEPASPSIEYQLYSPNNNSGLSMKRSLQRFLQKRKHRVLATSPY